MDFMFDVETLGVESNSVVLSAAITPFSFETSFDDPVALYGDLLDATVFVKFNVEEQTKRGRKIDMSTVEWWKEQDNDVRKMSFMIDPQRDTPVLKGLQILADVITKAGKNYTMWQRGGLDQIVLDSLSATFEFDRPTNYWQWYDVRTFLALQKESTVRGYATVPNFDYRHLVKKHDPCHDCAYDVLMMLAGK